MSDPPRKNGRMSSRDDAALARAAQAGEASGLGALFERHRARLYAIAVGMLGHGADAEDAVQDTIVIALRRIGELREPAAVGGWLTTIVVNTCWRSRLELTTWLTSPSTVSSRVRASTRCSSCSYDSRS